VISIAAALFLAACATYYDPADRYVRGLRFFDRGDYRTARQQWEPLAAAGDCDAEFRLGLLYFLAYGVNRDVPKALALWNSAANRGQPRAQSALGDVYFRSEADTQLFCRIDCGFR
jgi:TPR repeat protein